MIIFIGIAILLAGIFLLFIASIQSRQFGILKGERLYEDTEAGPGKTLYAKTINLVGRPDYIVNEHGHMIPVEVKTGKTPLLPYRNHIMQLTAYCFLIEETFREKPSYGYIKYPDREFKVHYTQKNKELLIQLVKTIIQYKISNRELFCNHKAHNGDIAFEK